MLGSVLHTYNLVRQIAPLSSRPIQLLEHLCDLFVDNIFLGSRPKRNFKNVLFRFQGAGLAKETKRSNNKKGKTGRKERNAKPQLGAPETIRDNPLDAAGHFENERLKAYDLSLFHLFRNLDPPFLGNPEFWMRVFTNRRVKTATTQQTLVIEERIREAPYAIALDRIKDVTITEFTGPFPVAKINFFKIYDLATEVLKEIARRYQQSMPRQMEAYQTLELVQPPPADAAAGYSFIVVLMLDIDKKMETPGNEAQEEHGGVKLVWDALEKVLEGKSEEDFLWKHL